jgi:hypothetical protein
MRIAVWRYPGSPKETTVDMGSTTWQPSRPSARMRRATRVLPWLCITLSAVMAAAVYGLWADLHVVDRLSLLSDIVFFCAAFPGLLAHRRNAWTLLLIGTLIQMPYGIAGLIFGSYGQTEGFIGRLLGVAVVSSLLWKLRPAYT